MWLDSKAVNCPQKWGNFNPELEGVRAWPQEPRRRHDLAERGCNCRVGTTEERSSRRPAAVLEPRGPDREVRVPACDGAPRHPLDSSHG